MKIEFSDQFHWSEGLGALRSWAKVDGQHVRFFLEGRALAEYFGVENEPWPLEAAFIMNRAFMEGIISDAIHRRMFNSQGEVLLGKRELTPYFRERDKMLSATNVPA